MTRRTLAVSHRWASVTVPRRATPKPKKGYAPRAEVQRTVATSRALAEQKEAPTPEITLKAVGVKGARDGSPAPSR
jgi:hypothetical protein